MNQGQGSLEALLDALDRGKCIFSTNNVVVELDKSYVPAGPVTMVLDDTDIAALRELLNDH